MIIVLIYLNYNLDPNRGGDLLGKKVISKRSKIENLNLKTFKYLRLGTVNIEDLNYATQRQLRK